MIDVFHLVLGGRNFPTTVVQASHLQQARGLCDSGLHAGMDVSLPDVKSSRCDLGDRHRPQS